MTRSFSTNVFIRGAVAFYAVSYTEPGIYLLTLQHCRLQVNPPPTLLRISCNTDGNWVCVDQVPDEFLFIAAEVGKRIQLPNVVHNKTKSL
jgi:hypothetical protein